MVCSFHVCRDQRVARGLKYAVSKHQNGSHHLAGALAAIHVPVLSAEVHNGRVKCRKGEVMVARFPADIETSIRNLVSTGRFENEAEVIREALRLLGRREQRIGEIRTSIQAGLAEYERGEAIDLTEQVWDRIEQEAAERTAQGIAPKSDVCP
jgi:putative addiction module CopG family antidote